MNCTVLLALGWSFCQVLLQTSEGRPQAAPYSVSPGWERMGAWTVLPDPILSISKTHSGNFTQGQTGATYAVAVSNSASAGPTSGTVTVTESVPTGLTLVSMAGSGWNCVSSGNTCTRSDILSQGSSFPGLTVTVNVSSNASSPLTNQVTVSGGGSAKDSAGDATSIDSPLAAVASPIPGSSLTSTTVSFQWNAVAGADRYWLDVGNAVAVGDIWGGSTTASAQTVSGIPCGGQTVYVQLYTHIGGAWSAPRRYTYAALAACSGGMTSPPPGSTLSGATVEFVWNSVTGADQYWLDVGTSAGIGDISAGVVAAPSKLVSGLPCDGRTLFVQLYSHVATQWLFLKRYTYTAYNCGIALAQITSPVPLSTLTTATATFTWIAAAGATQYWLDVGTSAGQGDLWAEGVTTLSKTVAGLPCDGRTIHVQLYTQVNGAWQAPLRYTYTAPTGCVSQISSPPPSTTLSGTNTTFTWNSTTGADQYWLDVGTSIARGDLSAGTTTATSRIVPGLPCDGRVLYVQLYTHMNGGWQAPQRYTYTARTGCGL